MLGGLQSRERLKGALRCCRGKPLSYTNNMKTIEQNLEKTEGKSFAQRWRSAGERFEKWAEKNPLAYVPIAVATTATIYCGIEIWHGIYRFFN